MTQRRPLIIISDQIQQIPDGDTVGFGPELIDATNDDSANMVFGQPVYILGANNNIRRSRANFGGTKKVIGLVASSTIKVGNTGKVLTSGILTGTTSQWDTVTGGSGGLNPGSRYFLSLSTFGISNVAPSAGYIVPLGYAINSTSLKIDVEPDIEL